MALSAALAALLGGLGLFLLGMWLMTEGLKLAAGNTLRRVLAAATGSPVRALMAGVGLTATVQSSSAVTVATVGFVNAGLLGLAQAVWVIYGSNVGTTMTGWIVAATGVEIKLDLYALPLIGLGMLLRITGPGTRRAAYGQALAGFAVFLLGVQALKSNFSELSAHVDFATLPGAGWQATAIYFGIGLLLTVVIQSSSATTAIAISAAAAGIVPVPLAALVIIGADIGTSATAAIAAVGATSNARRAAAAHVLFNVVTTVFAVAALPWLIPAAIALRDMLSLPDTPGVTLALFATMFNVIGVILMLPLTTSMTRFLDRRFVSREEDLARLRHLDDTLLAVPALTLRGLVLETQRLGGICLQLAAERAEGTPQAMEDLRRRGEVVSMLADRIRDYVGRMNRSLMPGDVAGALAPILRALQHYEEISDLAVTGTPPDAGSEANLNALRHRLTESTRVALNAADTSRADFDPIRLAQTAAAADGDYEAIKAFLLQAAADGRLTVPVMEQHMEDIARLHRATERAVKAAQRLAPFRSSQARDRAQV
jgi:phosphate:Na+ symporter